MSTKWPKVRLGEVIRQRKEFVTIDDLTTYKRPRVKLHVQGIVLRDELPGALIKTKQQQVCRSGEFLVAEIDAKVGGFGIVPGSLDGAIVSSHYFLFGIDESKLDGRYLDFFIRTPAFSDQVNAQGSTNYAAIRPADVLGYEMPLPQLSEQRRVVARIEELAVQINEARSLRKQVREMAGLFLNSKLASIFKSLIAKHQIQMISSLGSIYRGRLPNYIEGSGIRVINQKCVRWEGIDLSHAKEVTPVWDEKLPTWAFTQTGDIAINSTGEGTIGRCCIVMSDQAGHPFDSHVLIVRPNPNLVCSSFLSSFLKSPLGQQAIENSKGAKTTKQTELGTTKLGAISLPIPPLPEQRRIMAELEALMAEVDEVKRLQAETNPELEALLPSILDKAFKREL